MRKKLKQQAEELVEQIGQAHDLVKEYIRQKNISRVMEVLEDCQNGGISLGTLIEKTEGEGHPTTKLLEEYCELIYSFYERVVSGEKVSANNVYKALRKKLFRISASLKNDVKVRLEAVFLPYKASMWDSLESIWQAAEADPDCDAYVVPIPYYTKKPDGSFGEMHYEAVQYPEDVPITLYRDYNLADHCPDIVFIHNPYDDKNYVTSIHPDYYSDNIKKYTDCLVYVPYYATSGGMSEGQALCPAYIHADYIVIQSEKFKKYFDEHIPEEKFLVLGSPKFDSVIRKCQTPPAPPEEWKEKMKGRKVYFYNTSINGMLADTEAFLKKMRYVFDMFKGRQDACLLWRPHPLLESTFDSLRPEKKPIFDALKKAFREENIGILDETPDMEISIALSDVYIGDAATSVTSLFGVAGKPLFILNNYIHSLPEEGDWRGERTALHFDAWGDDRYQVTNNNQLWYSEKNDYHYRFFMDLGTGYSGGRYYLQAMEIKGRLYVAPFHAQNLLVIKDKTIRKVEFQKFTVQGPAFIGCWRDREGKYLYLYPHQYPYFIRFCIETEKVEYIDGIKDFYIRYLNEKWEVGGTGVYKNDLVFASPVDNQFVFLDMETLQTRVCYSGSRNSLGIQGIVSNGEGFWLLPRKGMIIIHWNPSTGETREYSDVPKQFKAVSWPLGCECDDHPFGGIAFLSELGEEESRSRKKVLISPNWGNMYLILDPETGRMEEWKPPFGTKMRGRNGYYLSSGMGGVVVTMEQYMQGEDIEDCRIWYLPERKLYDVNIFTNKCKEIVIELDHNDLLEHEPGFMEESEWMQYCLSENVFNSLENLLEGHVCGNSFHKERQLEAFSKVNANTDGTCGRNVYEFTKGKVL